MKAIYTLLLLISFSGFAQVETELTNFLNLPCNATVCQDIQLGVCPGDTHEDGTPYTYTDFQIYYVTEDVIIEFNSLILRNCRLEFRNGANLVDNGITITESNCDGETNTEIVFLGGGDRFETVAEMNATLSINHVDTFYRDANIIYYDIFGKKHKSLNSLSRGIYIIEYSLDGRIERKKHIKQ